MLSFMREQGGESLPGNQTTGSGQQDGAAPSGGEPQEYLTVAANSKSLRRSTIVVGVLVAAGLAGLGYMIHQSQPQAASGQVTPEQESSIELAIGRLTGIRSEMVGRMDEIVKKFYEFSDVFQVEEGELVKNPFQAVVFMEAIQDEAATKQSEAERAALIRREQLKKRAETLKLLSVMRSDDGNACMINDRILHRGDLIEGFTITRIGGDSVELTWRSDEADQAVTMDDLTIMLELAQ